MKGAKMMKKNMSLALILVLVLTACENRDSKLVGTWTCDYEGIKSTYVFKEDGKGSQNITVGENSSDKNYTYKTKDGKILITFDDDKELEYPYGYRFDKNDLILKDSLDEEFTCKRK